MNWKKKDQKTVIQVLRWVTTFYIKSFVTIVSKKYIFFTQVTVWRGDSTRKFSKKTSRKNLTYKTKIQKVMKNKNKNNSTQT